MLFDGRKKNQKNIPTIVSPLITLALWFLNLFVNLMGKTMS